MKKYVIKLNGKVYEVEMEEVTGEVAATKTETVQPAPQNTVKEISIPKTPVAPVSGGETISAPMPGNIVNVSVKPGDVVKKGQLLLVLEAMKMENEIVSPVDGQIVSVAITKGQSVNVGEALVQIA